MDGTTTGTVRALGDPALLAGYALAGVPVVPAVGAVQTCRAWDDLADDVALVVLTPAAAALLGDRRTRPGARLSVVIPG